MPGVIYVPMIPTENLLARMGVRVRVCVSLCTSYHLGLVDKRKDDAPLSKPGFHEITLRRQFSKSYRAVFGSVIIRVTYIGMVCMCVIHREENNSKRTLHFNDAFF